MKLSEAVTLGAILRPQAFGAAFKNGGSCAFGAAMEAVGMMTGDPYVDDNTSLAGVWPWILRPLDCPECDLTESMGASVISSHLNDTHRWTREEIAAWIATVEPQETEIRPIPSELATEKCFVE